MGPQRRVFAEDPQNAGAIATVASHYGGTLNWDLLAHLTGPFPTALKPTAVWPYRAAFVYDCEVTKLDSSGVAFHWLGIVVCLLSQSAARAAQSLV